MTLYIAVCVPPGQYSKLKVLVGIKKEQIEKEAQQWMNTQSTQCRYEFKQFDIKDELFK